MSRAWPTASTAFFCTLEPVVQSAWSIGCAEEHVCDPQSSSAISHQLYAELFVSCRDLLVALNEHIACNLLRQELGDLASKGQVISDWGHVQFSCITVSGIGGPGNGSWCVGVSNDLH